MSKLAKVIDTALENGNYYLGKLVDDLETNHSNVVYQHGNELRAQIKLISTNVSNLLDSDQSFILIGNRLRPAYIPKDYMTDNENIIADFRDELENNLIAFRVEKALKGTVLKAIDICAVPIEKQSFNNESTFVTIPFFEVNTEKTDISTFIQQMIDGKSIFELRNFLENNLFDARFFDNNYIPPYVIVDAATNATTKDAETFVIGPLIDIEKSDKNFILRFDDSVQIIKEDESLIWNNYCNKIRSTKDSNKASSYFIESKKSQEISDKLNNVPEGTHSENVNDINTHTQSINFLINNSSENHDNVVENNLDELIIQRFKVATETEGLFYSLKDLYNFHTSMKTGNLVILAGMSGTGKSKIVNCYKEALGLEKSQYIKIPVRPFWQDDSDLLGYLDNLNNIYRPADSGLIDFLSNASKEDNQNKLFIICFDEMNLARVEHYFSQFLSVLEETKKDHRKITLYNKEYEYRLYNSNKYTPSIQIGSNILIVGTVNLDESTYHFSDKVLDRSNVLQLGVLPFHELSNYKSKVKNETLKPITIEKELYFDELEENKLEENNYSLNELELKFLWDLHQALVNINDRVGVGYRIISQISEYLKCLPDNEVITRKDAFDLQIVQRIVTKIRGGEDQLKEFIGEYDRDIKAAVNSEFLNLLDKNKEISEFRFTREKIHSLSKELTINGHTF